jgi:hypothetical protein
MRSLPFECASRQQSPVGGSIITISPRPDGVDFLGVAVPLACPTIVRLGAAQKLAQLLRVVAVFTASWANAWCV